MCSKYIGLAATNPDFIFWEQNNKGTDQPSHQYSLISAIVICFLKSIKAL